MGRFSNLEFGGREPLREDDLGGTQEVRDEQYYLRLGDLDYRGARFERALRYYSRALEFNANVHAAWVGQVQMLVELGEYKEARLWADKALEVHRDLPELLSVKAVALARAGETQRAIEFSDASLAQKGATSLVWLARGEALLSGRRSNDDHCFESAAREARQDWFTQLRIALIYEFYGQAARALGWVLKAVAQGPDSPFAFHVLGNCQMALGIGDAAETAWHQALSLDPGFVLSSEALNRRNKRGLFERLREQLASWRRKGAKS